MRGFFRYRTWLFLFSLRTATSGPPRARKLCEGVRPLRFKGWDLAYREVQEPRPGQPKAVLLKPRHKPPKDYPPPTPPWRHQNFGAGYP